MRTSAAQCSAAISSIQQAEYEVSARMKAFLGSEVGVAVVVGCVVCGAEGVLQEHTFVSNDAPAVPVSLLCVGFGSVSVAQFPSLLHPASPLSALSSLSAVPSRGSCLVSRFIPSKTSS